MKKSLKWDSLNIVLIHVFGLEGTFWPLENPDSAVSVIRMRNDSWSISVFGIHNDLYYSSFKFPFYSGSTSNNNQITTHYKIKAASSQKLNKKQ